MKMKLVSIVLPVYNGERYIKDAIESILNKTYRNFELIIVDDRSTDQSLEIAKSFQNKDNRIKIILNQENYKLPRSLERGFDIAKGDYLTWTSDDNLYHESAIEKMVKVLEEHSQYDFVYTDMKKIDDKGMDIGSTRSGERDVFLYNCIGACFLYRHSCRGTIGAYDPEMFLVEDYDYWIRISQKYKIYHLSESLYSYRMHSNSLTMSRMACIGQQLLKLKLKYFDYLYCNVDDDKRDNFIFELLVYDNGCLDNRLDLKDAVARVKNLLPIIEPKSLKEVYLYGAGAIGQQAIMSLKETKIIGFIDADVSKIGKSIMGIPIVLLEDIKDKNIPIIISTDVRTAYSIVKKLREHGFERYDIFYRLL